MLWKYLESIFRWNGIVLKIKKDFFLFLGDIDFSVDKIDDHVTEYKCFVNMYLK